MGGQGHVGSSVSVQIFQKVHFLVLVLENCDSPENLLLDSPFPDPEICCWILCSLIHKSNENDPRVLVDFVALLVIDFLIFRATSDEDVRFKVLYCGICHTDLHLIKNDWGFTKYPILPGHEITGIGTEVGSKVQNFKVGDKVGVDCMVGACHSCDNCEKSLENYCPKIIATYNSPYFDGTITYGGYSDHMVGSERYIVRIPDNLPLDYAAPLLCVGITTYSPLRYFGLDKPGMSIGVVGLGGLGHVAVKLAKAFGTKVTVISTSLGKKKEAIELLGADSFLVSTDPAQMQVFFLLHVHVTLNFWRFWSVPIPSLIC
ncbi:8-hydroxygeraniol dehydrogenase [Sarracenia purpurea var. burkii]